MAPTDNTNHSSPDATERNSLDAFEAARYTKEPSGAFHINMPYEKSAALDDDKSGSPLLLKHVDSQFLTNTPPDIFKAASSVAVAKMNTPLSGLLVGGFMSGAYLGFAGLILTIVVGGMRTPTGLYSTNPGIVSLIGGLTFPPGLILVILSGSDLFTSNIFYFTAGLLDGKVKWHAVLRSWVVSWFANLLGSLTIVYFVHWAGILGAPTASNTVITYAKAIAINKSNWTFHGAVLRGIMCNWLVCMAVWQGMASTDVIGKIFGIYLPVAYFVIAGFEHCIANQYLLFQGLAAGAKTTASHLIWRNLIPSTIGCIVGGVCFVACASWWNYGQRKLPGRSRVEKYPF